jgi:hypothetical protein
MKPPNKRAAPPAGKRGQVMLSGSASLTRFPLRRNRRRRFAPSRLRRITCAWGPIRRFGI